MTDRFHAQPRPSPASSTVASSHEARMQAAAKKFSLKHDSPITLDTCMQTTTDDGMVTVTQVLGSLCGSWPDTERLSVTLAIQGTVRDDDGADIPFKYATSDHYVSLADLWQLRQEQAGRSDISLNALRARAHDGVKLLLRRVDLSSGALLAHETRIT